MTTTLRPSIPVPFPAHCSCEQCGLYPKNLRLYRPVGGEGSSSARIVFIGEGPGANEFAMRRPFVGKSGELLDEALREVGLVRSDCYITNAVMCHHFDGSNPNAAEIASCNARLRAELHALPERHVFVLLGSSAIRAVTGEQQSVGKMQGRIEWHPEWNVFFLYTWHPAAVLRSVDHTPDFVHALQTAKSLLSVPKGTILQQHPVTYTLYDTKQSCLALLARLTTYSGIVSCDIETGGEKEKDGLEWQKGRVRQIGFSWDGNTAHISREHLLLDTDVVAALRTVFRAPNIRWLWHNGKFDVQFLAMHLGMMPRIDEDTMLKHYALDERTGGGDHDGGATHRLEPLCVKYAHTETWKEIGKQDDFTNPEYHAKDLAYTYRLNAALDAEHAQQRPSAHGYPLPFNAYRTVMIPAINEIADIEMIGFPIDVVEMERLRIAKAGEDVEDELGKTVHRDGELDILEKRCQELAGIRFPREQTVYVPYTSTKLKGPRNRKVEVIETKRRREKLIIEEPINIRSPKQIAHFLYSYLKLPIQKGKGKTTAPSTDVETLELFEERHPFIHELLKYRKEQKLYATYVSGISKTLDATGATHSHFNLHTTVTGRPSSVGPNLQNIPKAVKSPFISRPGYTLLEADYSNQEVRVGAYLSGDKQLQADIAVKDFHWEVTQAVFHVIVNDLLTCKGSLTKLEDLMERRSVFRLVQIAHATTPMDATKLFSELRAHIRKAAKAVTFGVMYGEGGHGLAHTLYAKSDIEITVEEGSAYIANWLTKYPGFATWAARSRREVETVGFVDTPTGRRRRFPLLTEETQHSSERQAMNMPIQSLSSDMTILSVTRIHRALKEREWGHVLLFVHDSIIVEVLKGKEYEAALLMREVMENIIYAIDPSCPVRFPVDISLGERWSSVKELDTFLVALRDGEKY